ncbi:MAG: hypothetical protein IKW78_01155 [Prevotella sp.]|nr:hypothetical protein [Prevotella sp.]
MTAIELKTSINEDLNVLGIETLEYVSKYVRRLALHVRNRREVQVPRKVKISGRIRRMSGRFTVPANIDYKTLKTDSLEEKYNKTLISATTQL